jgi:hypothetical protein
MRTFTGTGSLLRCALAGGWSGAAFAGKLSARPDPVVHLAGTQGIAPDQAQRGDIELFLAHRTFDESIAARSLARQLTAIKRYQRWLLREGRRDDDPTLTVAAPRLPKPLPKTCRMRCRSPDQRT